MLTEKRLIDADAFAGCLERMTKTAYPNLFPGLLEAIDFVKDFPTVDAVEVVRCRGCRWYLPDLQVCGLHSESKETIEDGFAVGMDPDGFCSYGEIKREGVTGGA